MANLILVRHSEPDWGRQALHSEWVLTGHGRYRATLLGEYRRERHVDRIISSPEVKAFQTADIAAKATGLERQVSEPKLNEHNRDGEKPLNSNDRRNIIFESLRNPQELVYGTESINTALERFRTGIIRHVDKSSLETVAVVSHGTVISAFVEDEIGIDSVET